jgi:hypothetical protein
LKSTFFIKKEHVVVEIHQNTGTGRGDKTIFLANRNSEQQSIRKQPLSRTNKNREIVLF